MRSLTPSRLLGAPPPTAGGPATLDPAAADPLAAGAPPVSASPAPRPLLVAAVLLGAALAVAGWWGQRDATAPDRPADTAAVLSLHDAQRSAVGAADSLNATRLAAARDGVADALAKARSTTLADPRAAAYWDDADHDALGVAIADATETAEQIALLEAAHALRYEVEDEVAAAAAEPHLTSLFRTGLGDPHLARWADTLLEAGDGRDRADEAVAARDAALAATRADHGSLRPAAEDRIATYLLALPPEALDRERRDPRRAQLIDEVLGRSGR